jgi:hypothetical protein
MMKGARLSIIAAVLSGFMAAAARADIPNVPDADRYIAYSPVTPTSTFAVPFPIYGDCSDLRVSVGQVVLANSAFTCSSISGTALTRIARPIQDLQITLSTPANNTSVEILGSWHPRFGMASSPGITRDEFNRDLGLVFSAQREMFRALNQPFPAPVLNSLQDQNNNIVLRTTTGSVTSTPTVAGGSAYAAITSGLQRALNTNQTLTGTSAVEFAANIIGVTSDNVFAPGGSNNGVSALSISHSYGGGTGARQSLLVQSNLLAPSDATSGNRNYVAISGFGMAFSGDGGTGLTTGTARGAVFGGNFVAGTPASPITAPDNLLTVAGIEIDAGLGSGSTAIRNGLRVAGYGLHQGAVEDAAISINSFASSVLWNYGVFFGNTAGALSVSPSGTLIAGAGATGNQAVANGTDYRAFTFSGVAFASTGFLVNGAGGVGAANIALANITGSTQCLQANSGGLVTGTGVACNAGTVTSVALSLPSIFTVSGSPVTTTGTLTAALASQSAALVFASPSGGAGAPTFRKINLSTDLDANTVPAANTAALTGDVTKTAGNNPTVLATAQPAVHTWALAQTFTVAPVFTDQSGTRTALGLGTAAVAATGTSGHVVGFLDGVNTWSGGSATFTASSGQMTFNMGTAYLQGSSAVAAQQQFNGFNSASATRSFVQNTGFVNNATAGSEAGSFFIATYQAGVLANRVAIGAGLFSAANVDQGAETINFTTYYAAGTVGVTCAAGAVTAATMTVKGGVVTHC